MVDQNLQMVPPTESKKRAFCTQEIIGRFRSKQDFVDYFTHQRKQPNFCLTALFSPTLHASGIYDRQRLP